MTSVCVRALVVTSAGLQSKLVEATPRSLEAPRRSRATHEQSRSVEASVHRIARSTTFTRQAIITNSSTTSYRYISPLLSHTNEQSTLPLYTASWCIPAGRLTCSLGPPEWLWWREGWSLTWLGRRLRRGAIWKINFTWRP